MQHACTSCPLVHRDIFRLESFWWKPPIAPKCWRTYTDPLWGCTNTSTDLAENAFLRKQFLLVLQNKYRGQWALHEAVSIQCWALLLLWSSEGKIMHPSSCWWLVSSRDMAVDKLLNTTAQNPTLYLSAPSSFCPCDRADPGTGGRRADEMIRLPQDGGEQVEL